MKEMENLRVNIRRLREENDLSRNQLAKKSHLSPFTIIDIELGRNSDDVKLSTLVKLSKGLDVSTARLLE